MSKGQELDCGKSRIEKEKICNEIVRNNLDFGGRKVGKLLLGMNVIVITN